jgi:AcrR family transcriptional regulator/DNA-binding MarR family transcriptional regulator
MPRVRVRGASAPSSTGGDSRRPAAQRRRSAGPSAAVAPPDRLVEIQRSRLLVGAVGAIDEFGYAQATVAQITARARVSRRTFYELFDNREECLAALVEDAVALLEYELDAANLAGLPWRERVRGGLTVVLSFLDREPALARVCVVQAMRGGSGVLARRERILARLAETLDEGRREGARGEECTALTAEGLVGAAFGIVYTRLLREEHAPLICLLGELMSMIVLPYLGPAAARREQSRPAAMPTGAPRPTPARLGSDRDPLQEVPMRLTYRTARVLGCIAEQSAISNRAVAERAGVSDQGQISKLLARLRRLGLIENIGVGHARGEPNAWKLTELGRQVAQRLNINTRDQKEAA